jgi:uncharacterized protein YaaQ
MGGKLLSVQGYVSGGNAMQLLVTIVQAEDADLLVDRLTKQDVRATRINSQGSFLARGNATILMGLEDNQVERVLRIIRATCQTRRSFVNPVLTGVEPMNVAVVPPQPLEVVVGGAVIFSLPVKRLARLSGGTPPAEEDTAVPAQTSESQTNPIDKGAAHMDLLVAIVQSEDADNVVRGLLNASYRVTRLNSAGGFLRRGNATLLIGITEDKIDHVMHVIQSNCRLRAEANPPDSGMPMYSATVFVVEASRFLRV